MAAGGKIMIKRGKKDEIEKKKGRVCAQQAFKGSQILCRCSRILALNRMKERNTKINEILSWQILSAVAK